MGAHRTAAVIAAVIAVVLALYRPLFMATAGVNTDLMKLIAQLAITVILLGAALYVILSKRYPSAIQEWAFGVIGVVLGYWLPGPR